MLHVYMSQRVYSFASGSLEEVESMAFSRACRRDCAPALWKEAASARLTAQRDCSQI